MIFKNSSIHNRSLLKLSRRRPRAAFSLIEVMVAVSVVALGMLATVGLLANTRSYNSMEQERARARQIIYEEAERNKNELFSRITSGRAVTVWDNGTPADLTDDTQGTLQVIVRDKNGTLLFATPVPAEGVQVEITLSWQPRGRLGGKTYRETVMTYIAP